MRPPAVACAARLVLALPGSAGAVDGVSGRLIVGFTTGTSHQRAASLVQGAGARIERGLDRTGALLIRPRRASATKGRDEPAASGGAPMPAARRRAPLPAAEPTAKLTA
jgi:hypothetical protein